jgi:GH15 family glucan-1,4-alpha-glucosidase
MVELLYQPRPGYAKRVPALRHRGALGWSLAHGGIAVHLVGNRELRPDGEGALSAAFPLQAGESAGFVLCATENDVATLNAPGEALLTRLRSTLRWWREWIAPCCYEGPYQAALRRTCLLLKLLSYSLSGAMIAAPTTSLPAAPRGDRNWDYRYCWLRDASLVLGCFVELGFSKESAAFTEWLLHATRLTHPRLQVLYDVYGEARIAERPLPHLAGYGSRGPVRVGNAAHRQVQMDVYGELLAAVGGYAEKTGRLDEVERKFVAGFGRTVRKLWSRPDHGIWEIRGEPRHHTHSRLMSWVALDALLKIHARFPLRLDAAAVRNELNAIRNDIEAHGYAHEVASFVGYYGGREPDASVLLMPRHGFLDAADPRMDSTYAYIERELCAGPLLYRYPPQGDYDGTGVRDNFFAPASFWRVDYLARRGRHDEACRLFEQLLGVATPLGLYAEGFSDTSGTAAGNFPQAFTHVEMLHAALVLEQTRPGAKRHARVEAAHP